MAKQTEGMITVSFREDKLRAVEVFLKEKGMNVEDELSKHMEGLYKKYVPAAAKTFIEANDEKTKDNTLGIA